MRPIDRLITYLKGKGIPHSNAEQSLDVGNGYISKQSKGKGSIGSEVLERIVERFTDLDLVWLVTGKGSMEKKNKENASPTESPTASPTAKNGKKSSFKVVELPANAPESHRYEKNKVVSYLNDPGERILQVDNHGHELIPITDIRVAAGGGIFNEDGLQTVDNIQLPDSLTKKGYHLAVRIKGASMAPTLQDGGFMIVRLLDRSEWSHLTNEHIYVVTNTNGESYIKRVKNRFKQGFIVCMSDNPDKATYPNFNLEMDEVANIWHAEWYLSARMPNIHDQYYSRLQRLEDIVDGLVKKQK